MELLECGKQDVGRRNKIQNIEHRIRDKLTLNMKNGQWNVKRGLWECEDTKCGI